MVEVRTSNPPAQVINERLGNLPTGRTYSTEVETNPTRTVTCVYPSGFQASKGDAVKKGQDNG